MGIFDLFGGGAERTFRRHSSRVADKRAQALERMASIEYLAEDASPEACVALLRRFSFYAEPSITDEEEKERAFRGIIAAGEDSLDAVREYAARTENLVWPLKMLEELLDEDTYVAEALSILARFDTEYERDPQRKVDLLSLLGERKDPRIVPAASRFLEDVNETVRFHTVGALLHQEDEEGTRDVLLAHLVAEESVRVRNRILDGFAALGWGVQGHRAEVEKLLPKGYVVDRAGQVKAPSSPARR